MLHHIAARLEPVHLGSLRCCRALRFHPALLEGVQRARTDSSLGRGELLPFLLRLSNLRRLSLGYPESLFYLSQLSGLHQLRKVCVFGGRVVDFTPLHCLPSLEAISLRDCGSPAGLAGLSLTKLTLTDVAIQGQINLEGVQALALDQPIEGVATLTALTKLRLNCLIGPSGVYAREFARFAQLTRLRVLNSAAGPPSYAALPTLQQLTHLILSRCDREPAQLTVLSSLTGLQRLALRCVTQLPALSLRVTALLLSYNNDADTCTVPHLRECSRLQELCLRVDMAQGQLVVAADRLPLQDIAVFYSRNHGQLLFDSELHERGVPCVRVRHCDLHKFV